MRIKKDGQSVGVAVVGLGRGKTHVKALKYTTGAELLAVCDMNEEAAEKVAGEYEADAYTDLQLLLKRDDIDLVHICTPSGTHAEMALRVAESGKHALVEKPLDISLERIDEVVHAFENRNLKLGCVFQNRFAPVNRLMKQAIDEGRLGKLIMANAHIKWFRNQQYYDKNGGWRGTWAWDGGGSLMNQSVHTIDLMQWMMGPVQSVIGKTRVQSHHIETEDMGVAIIKFANGALGTVAGSTATYPGFGTALEIHGDRGGICMNSNRVTAWKIDGERMEEEEAEMLEKLGGSKRKKSKDEAAERGSIEVNTTYLQIQDMVDAIRENRAPNIPGKEGRHSVEIILAIYESSRTGKEVFLNGS